MDRVFDYIEQLRNSSESRRYRVLIVTVTVTVLILGTVWFWLLRAQLSPIAASVTAQDSSLPSVGELISKEFLNMTSRTKASLRSLILETEKQQKLEDANTKVPLTQTPLSGELAK